MGDNKIDKDRNCVNALTSNLRNAQSTSFEISNIFNTCSSLPRACKEKINVVHAMNHAERREAIVQSQRENILR